LKKTENEHVSKTRILIVEDEMIVAEDLACKLGKLGYEISGTTRYGEDAIIHARELRPDLVLMDIQLAGTMNGIEAAGIIGLEYDLPVIYLTAHSDRATLEQAKVTESFGYLLKPFDDRVLGIHIEMALYKHQAERKLRQAHDELELRVSQRTSELQAAFKEINQLKDRLQAENICLRQEVAREYNFGEIIGQSDAIVNVFERIKLVSPLNATVLLMGETGTGKGLVARAIHGCSTRKGRSMITVNCAALPANLIESELFGRERGAFTGSNAQQLGRFEVADGGTIFLDEIGEMPLELQSKLLRVIQDGEMERLGSPHTIKIDVRIIAASNRNLQDEISKGKFRKDLFYRLNVFPISIPPLRQRTGDIALLVNFFVAKFNKKTGKNIETVPKDTLDALQEYHWPGNVRELESVVERAVITSPGSSLRILDRFETSRKTAPVDGNVKALADLERDHILQVLRQTGWRIEGKRGAATLLDINPSTLRARMRKFGIRRQ
jgi:DNA-binding NtrC family response regulator